MISYGRHWLDEEDIQSVVEILRSDWITQGPIIEHFEKAIAAYCQVKYAVVVSSGTAALHIACLAAGIKDGYEVITPPITFVASSNCILYCGGTPVFADIQKETVNIDPTDIEKKCNEKTKAIIPVHFAGQPCDLEEIGSIAKKRDLVVIEDACHALGAEYNGLKIGSCKYSDMAVFSFHPVKHITTGEGGAVVTNRKDIYEKLLLLRNHGITKRVTEFEENCQRNFGPWYYEMQELGFNYRITDFQCALGISQLKKLDNFLHRRREIAMLYNEAFKDVENLIIPFEQTSGKSAWHLYVIRLNLEKLRKTRKEIFNELYSSGLGVQVHYIPVYHHPYYKKHGFDNIYCPEAERYYEEAITLPLFPKMSEEDVETAIEITTETINNA